MKKGYSNQQIALDRRYPNIYTFKIPRKQQNCINNDFCIRVAQGGFLGISHQHVRALHQKLGRVTLPGSVMNLDVIGAPQVGENALK